MLTACQALSNSTSSEAEIVYDDKIIKYDPNKTHLKPERVQEEPVTNPIYFYGLAILMSLVTIYFLYKILKYIFPDER